MCRLLAIFGGKTLWGACPGLVGLFEQNFDFNVCQLENIEWCAEDISRKGGISSWQRAFATLRAKGVFCRSIKRRPYATSADYALARARFL